MSPTINIGEVPLEGFKDVIELMFKSCEEYQGVGLTANQVGLIFSIFVMNFKEKGVLFSGVFINPEIVSHSDETLVAPEMCLSLPSVKVNKERWKTINARWKDAAGVVHEEEMIGMKAVIFQHEFDHCCGKTILSSLPAIKQRMVVEKMKKKLNLLIKSYIKRDLQA